MQQLNRHFNNYLIINYTFYIQLLYCYHYYCLMLILIFLLYIVRLLELL